MVSLVCSFTLLAAPLEEVAAKKKPWKTKAPKEKKERDFSYSGEALLIAEWMPRYQNGTVQKFQSWVQAQVVYPPSMKQQNVEGIVTASFVINSEGEIRGIEILRTPDERLGEEVMRVMKLSPRYWRPGYDADGKPVDVRMSIAVRFELK